MKISILQRYLGRFCIIGTLALSSLLSACTWVKVSAEGESVKLLTVAQAASCERVGATTSQALGKVGFVKRRETKLATELQTLARNEAAEMGGNAIVADGEIEEGRQRFVIYRCP